MNKAAFFITADMYFLRRIRLIAVYAKRHQHYAAKYLKDKTVLVIIDYIHNKTHAKTCYQRIDKIADCGPDTGNKAIPPPFVQRTLNAKNPDWPHRRRRDNTYKYTLENPVKYVKMKLKRHSECKIANFL